MCVCVCVYVFVNLFFLMCLCVPVCSHLQARDLRLLNPQLDDVQPSIMARVGATIVHLPPIRAVVLHNKVSVDYDQS